MITILIADQSYMVASGLAAMLNNLKEVTDVKITDNGKDCIHLMKQLKPNILFLNTQIFNPDEYETFKKIAQKNIKIMYLVYTPLTDDKLNNQLSIMLSKATIMDKIQNFVAEVSRNNSENEPTEELSPREKSILRCVALGLTNKEIAEKEFISTHTVISHRKNITRKLGIKTVSGLTVYSIINNIIQMNELR